MSKESNIQDPKLDQVINQQAEQIKKIQENIEKLVAANQQLRESKDLQDKVTEFKRENQPTSKFRKVLRVYPAVKHLFVKSTQQKIDKEIRVCQIFCVSMISPFAQFCKLLSQSIAN